MTNAIETQGLAKNYGTTRALDGVDLRIRKGSVYGLLGPNGAGKTTAIRILATLIRPDEGTAFVAGHDVVKEARLVREKVSLTGQAASVDEELTGHENLTMVGRLMGLPWGDAKDRATELLGAFGLDDAAKRLVRTYSGGMRRRIDIAASLVVTPEVLFLDEPTTGLDPRSRNQVWDIVRRIAGEGTTVLLTTQYLEEADRLAERLAVVDHGRLIAEGTSRDLKASVGANALHLRLAHAEHHAKAKELVVRSLGNGILPGTEPTSLAVKLASANDAHKVLAALEKGGVQVQEFTMGSPSLDDVFFALTGRPAEEKKDSEEEASPSGAPTGRKARKAAKAAAEAAALTSTDATGVPGPSPRREASSGTNGGTTITKTQSPHGDPVQHPAPAHSTIRRGSKVPPGTARPSQTKKGGKQ